LLHIVFYAKLGSEEKAFDIADVANDICEKLIHRHPHIYGSVSVEDADEVKKIGNLKIKRREKECLRRSS